MWTKILILAAGGALGTLARVGTVALSARLVGTVFPWGTFIVNAVGCFAFGFIFALSKHHLPMSANAKLLVLTGFMGAYTTFSTYAFESAQLMLTRDAGLAWMGNVIGQTVVGLVLMFAGLRLGQLA